MDAFSIWRVANQANNGRVPLVECNDALPEKKYICFLMEEGYRYLKGNVMLVNSEYDEVAL